MSTLTDTPRFLASQPAPFLRRPIVRIQPIMARQGTPNIDLDALARNIAGVAELAPTIAIRSPEHWESAVRGLGDDIDAILPVSITSYPTECWNSHPQPLIDRKLPFIFWPIIAFDEPDFWRWSARDFLSSLGIDVHLVASNRQGLWLLRALAMRRFLRNSSLIVIGEQNFPWNAHAAGHHVTRSLGTRILVKALADMRSRYERFGDAQVDQVWAGRQARYELAGVQPAHLRQAVRTYLAIKSMLEEERALGFGVNCFGDLVTGGGRDVPCLAQTLLREDGYIASCDGDFLAMMSMVLSTWFLDKPCMMSNMYPVQYEGALKDHFNDPLAPPARYPRDTWKNLARLGHCGFVGVVSPEMAPGGKVKLKDWGGTWEIKRDGRGCGVDGDLAAGEPITVLELKFDGKTLLLADGEVCQTTRHPGMPHCESTALLRFNDLEGFVRNISREHTVVVYGRHVAELTLLSQVLGLEAKVF